MFRKKTLKIIVSTLFFVTLNQIASGQSLPLVEVGSGFDRAVFATYAPGDPGRLFVVEAHSGATRILNTSDGSVLPAPFLTLNNVAQGAEQGLLGLAFHPDYANNGRLFVYYNEDGTGATVIEEYTRQTPDSAHPDGTLIWTFDRPNQFHNGGWIGFGPDGWLYISSGDADFSNFAQDTTSLLGKILRIDIDRDDFPSDPDRNYGIPASNPFVGQSGSDEVIAYGLRNPWRCSFDRATGDFYIGDVGDATKEEIDIILATQPSGANFGWDIREGTTGGPRGSMIDPIYDYGRSGNFGGVSVTGGYVYRGPNPHLQGKYFFIDWITNRLWSFEFDGTSDPQQFDGQNINNLTDWTDRIRTDSFISLTSSLAEDEDGNLYLIGLQGGVLKIDTPESQLATSVTVASGMPVDGGLAELSASDNQDMSVVRNPLDVSSRVTIELETTLPDAFPLMMDVRLEASVFSRAPVTQTVEFFNVQTQTWEQVDSRPASRFQDQTVIIAPSGDLARFVESATRTTRARIRFNGSSNRTQFAVNVDQFEWQIMP